MRFPSIKAVRKELVRANKTDAYKTPGEDDSDVEVRLQIYGNGEWAVRVGDPQYDLDGRGCWGCGYVRGNGRRCNLTELAKDLLDQCETERAIQTED